MENLELTLFVLCDTFASDVYEALRVNKPDSAARFLDTEAIKGEETQQLSSDTDTCRARAVEQDAVVAVWEGRKACSREKSSEDDSACALDVIVEERETLAEAREVGEGMICREVL